ncbi:MAG: hypothetical protein QM644_21725 [Mobilitalea sp.]
MNDDKLNALLAKVAGETDFKKRAAIIVADADDMLDEMAKAHAAETGVGYYEAYATVTKSELGAKVLATREDGARLVEAQSPI